MSMSNKSIIFLDIDGTLVNTSANPEFIPESAIKAVTQAKQNGCQIYLCTGRSKAEIYDFITEVGFDGVIGAAGGFIEVQGKEIFHETIDPGTAAAVAKYFDDHKIDFYLESNTGLYASRNLIPHLEWIMYGDVEHDPAAMAKKKEGSHFINALTVTSQMPMEDINKICFLETNGSRYQDIYDAFHDKFYMVRCTVPLFGDESGEMSVLGINKSTSIRILLDYLKADIADTYAIGDGMNDAEMLDCVNTGIAMGNAKEGLKKIADYITTDLMDDGIYNAFRHFGLI